MHALPKPQEATPMMQRNIPERRMEDERLSRFETKFDDFSRRVDKKFDTMADAMNKWARIEERELASRKLIESQIVTIADLERSVAALQQQHAIAATRREDKMTNAERIWWVGGMVFVMVATPIATRIVERIWGL